MSRKMRNKKKSRRVPATTKKRLANSGKKKFNQKDLSEFKKIILKRKDEILEGIKHISEDTLKKSQKDASGDISGYTYHMADVATDSYDREFSLGLATNERETLYELDDALKKIEDGTFGVCEECKVLITNVRLKAVPFARLCVRCQEKREER